MIIKGSFSESCSQYENFEVWDIESMEHFFSGNEVIATIFEDHYKFPVAEFIARRNEIPGTNREVIEEMLEYVGDKHFYLFTLHDPHHMDLIQMQKMNMMNFGVDIEDLKADHFYALIANKKAEA